MKTYEVTITAGRTVHRHQIRAASVFHAAYQAAALPTYPQARELRIVEDEP